MKISVLGATGGTGQQVVRMLLEQDHIVTAYVRSPEKLTLSDDHLTIVKGEIFDRPHMMEAIKDSDAVISCLGSTTTAKSEELTLMAASVVKVLQEAHIPKVVYLSTAGIQDEFKGVTKWFVYNVLGNVIADHKAAAKLYQHSNITYVIARPMRLKNGKATHKYHLSEEGLPKSRKPISRADVADFLIKAATTDQYDNKSIALSK